MNDLNLFQYDDQPMRVEMIDGEPWFVAADVCAVLGIANDRAAVASLDDDERGVATTDTPGGRQEINTVSESGLYSLILRSRRPEAKAIKRWVTHEVLPSIRRTGSYSTAPALPAAPPTRLELAQMVVAAETEIATLTAAVEELEPMAAFADRVMSADGDWSVRDAAQMLSRDPAIDTGQNRLFGFIRKLGWIDRTGTPYQKFIAKGYLDTRLQVSDHHATGEPTLRKPQVRITGRGIVELHKELGGQLPLQLSLDVSR